MWVAISPPSQNTVCFYISVFEVTRLQNKPSDKNKSAKLQFARELEIHVKHQGRGSQEGNYRWIPSGQKPDPQTLKKQQVPAKDLRGVSLPSMTQAESSPTNIKLPGTCQWHLITSVLPSASLLRHLDWLPSHRWLCWTNLASPWSYVVSPMGTWHKKTSLSVHLLWLISLSSTILCKSLNDVKRVRQCRANIRKQWSTYST